VVQDIIIPIDEMGRAIDLFHEMFEIYPLLVFPIAVFDNTKVARSPRTVRKALTPNHRMDRTRRFRTTCRWGRRDLSCRSLKGSCTCLPSRRNFTERLAKCERVRGESFVLSSSQRHAGLRYFDLGAYGVPQRVRDKKSWNARECIRALEAFTRHIKGYQCLYVVRSSPHAPVVSWVTRYADTFMTREEFRCMFDLTHYDAMRKKYQASDAFPEVYDKIRPEAGVLKVGVRRLPSDGVDGCVILGA
jgi:hypothetical protein